MPTASPMPTPYPFDPTGTASSNLVTGEQKAVTAANGQDYHFVVPTFGPFFSDSLQVSFKALDNSVRTLQEGVDYYPTHWFISASRACAKPVYGSISLLDLQLAGTLTIAYQTLGGAWTVDQTTIAQILADTLHNPRITSWDEVTDYPIAFPPIDHQWDLADMVGLSDLLPKIDEIQQAILTKNTTDLAAHLAADNPHHVTPHGIGTYTSQEIDSKLSTAGAGLSSSDASLMIQAAITAHKQEVDPHPQYDTDVEVQAAIANTTVNIAQVKKPKVVSPAADQVLSSSAFTIQGSAFLELYGQAQQGSEFQVSTVADFSTNVVVDLTPGAVQAGTIAQGTLAQGTYYYCRCRYQNIDGVWSQWSDAVRFRTGAAQIATPSITSPAAGATLANTTPTLQATAFAMSNGTDTQRSADWEIWTGANGTGTLAYSAYGDTSDLSSIVIPNGALQPSTTYHPRVRYNSNNSGTSAWSLDTTFVTAATATSTTPGNIGDAYGGGYFYGYMLEASSLFAMVVSPRAAGQIDLAQYPISALGNTDAYGVHDPVDGLKNTNQMVTLGASSYPAATRARALTINGFSDWYIPARDELELAYRNLKPTSDVNWVGQTGLTYSAGVDGSGFAYPASAPWNNGVNNNSSPAGAAYQAALPAVTPLALFAQGGSESLVPGGAVQALATSTWEVGAAGSLWAQLAIPTGAGNNDAGRQFYNGNSAFSYSGTPYTVRVVRKVQQNLQPGTSFGGGIFVGYIKPGDGHTYALIMAPRAQGVVNIVTGAVPGGASNAAMVYAISQNDVVGAHDPANGLANTQAMAAQPLASNKYPLAATLIAGQVVINGKSDWYIPALAEVEMLYHNFKPTAINNDMFFGGITGINGGMNNGANPYAYPTTPAYSQTVPAQNSDARFQYNGGVFGSEAVSLFGALMSSTWQNNNDVWYASMGLYDTAHAGTQGHGSPTAPASGLGTVSTHLVRRVQVA